VNARITRTNILQAVQANGNKETREMSALVDAIAGIVRSLSSQPNSVITDPTGAEEGHSFYSMSWHWHRFLGDAFGNAASAPRADSSFFRELTSRFTPAGGASGEIQITSRSFEQLFEDLVVAVSFEGTPHTPTYAIGTYDFATVGDIFTNPNPTGSYPWPVTATNSEQWVPFGSHTYSGPIGPSGVRFHDFRSSGSAAAQIQVTGSNQPCDGGPSGARCDVIIVTRLD
jgi:hypothetical protein